MKRICSVLLLFALLLSVIVVAGVSSSADETATEIQFRGFESQKADYGLHSANANHWGKNAPNNTPAVGEYYMGGVLSEGSTEIHHSIYSYNQGKENNADGTNADGCVKMLITDPTQMYAALDLYVSNASTFNENLGDCGFGVDTLEFGEFEKWGSTFVADGNTMRPVFKNLKDGWNHLLIPLRVKNSTYKTEMVNQTVTFCTMRLYAVGLKLPANFVTAVDDVRIMNKQAALTTYGERTVAKSVTDMIRAYPASATYADFYNVYAAYNATPDEYKSLIIGWDTFLANNASHKANGDTDATADKAAAASVITAVDALNKTITKEDSDSISTARAAYDALTKTQKVFVTHSALLTEAETQLAAIIKAENQAKAEEVRALIAALPKTVTINDKAAVEAARAAFNALTPEQQGMVINTAVLEKAEATLAKIEDQNKANVVFALIDALPATITNADKADVAAAREAYDALTDAQKELVSNYAALEAAEEQVKNLGDDEPTPPTPGEYRLGDLDGNDKIDAKDALLILKYAVNKIDKFPIEE